MKWLRYILVFLVLCALPAHAIMVTIIGGSATPPPADQYHYPTSDDTACYWTPSSGTDRYPMVDESGSHDSDTTYCEEQDQEAALFFDSNPSLPSGTILAVRLYWVVKEVSGDFAPKPRIYIGETAYTGSSQAATGDYVAYYQEYTENPDTSSAWLEADVEGTGDNPLSAWGILSSYLGSGETARCTQIYLKVIYN